MELRVTPTVPLRGSVVGRVAGWLSAARTFSAQTEGD